MFPRELTSEWVIRGLGNYALPHPLPELSLGGPELFPIAADYQCRFLFLLFFELCFRGHRLCFF